MTQQEIIAESNDRCNQENLIKQLKNGVRGLARVIMSRAVDGHARLGYCLIRG